MEIDNNYFSEDEEINVSKVELSNIILSLRRKNKTLIRDVRDLRIRLDEFECNQQFKEGQIIGLFKEILEQNSINVDETDLLADL